MADRSAVFARPEQDAGDRAGAYKFECLHDWGQVPDDIVLGNTHGVAEDAQGFIYVYHTVGEGSKKADAMVVFSMRRGNSSGRGARNLLARRMGCTCIAKVEEEFFYLTNYKAGTVVKTTLDGKVLWTAGWPKEAGVYAKPGAYKPTNVAISPDGAIVCGRWLRGELHPCLYAGWKVRRKPSVERGKEPGKFLCPHGLMVDETSGPPVLLVADRGNRRVQKLDLEGNHLGLIETGVRLPCHFKEHAGDAGGAGSHVEGDVARRKASARHSSRQRK